MNKLELERCTLNYTNISPFRINAAGLAERERYIKDELDGIEPTPPTYTVVCGGGVTPSGQRLNSWTEEHKYTKEHIAELHDERQRLVEQNTTPAIMARVTEIDAALAAWGDYLEKAIALHQAVTLHRRKTAIWHCYKDNLPEGDGWIEELAADGIDTSKIPDNERERLVYWIEKIAVSSQEELDVVVYTATQNEKGLALVNEARQVARRMFQRAVAG